jgi:glucan phosphorylase
MTAQQHRSALDQLQRLLETQIESARKGDFRRVEQIAQKTSTLINDIVATPPAEDSLFETQRRRIAELHRQLILMLAAEKENVGRRLKRLGAGRKLVSAYKDNL